MASSMKAYLAAKYMTGPKADAILAPAPEGTPKRKKRKTTRTASSTSATASFIKDDDALGWEAISKLEEEDDTTEAVIASDRGFKKRERKGEESGWATVREGVKKEEEESVPMDERPQVVEEEQPFRGGLMSAEQIRKQFRKQTQAGDLTQEEIAAAQETVYRDTTGRKIDTAAERAEAERKKREREEKEKRKMQWGKGLVQREETEKRRREEAALKGKGFARTVEDVELNEELKAQERWNDPAAAFLTKKKSRGPRRPEYTGPPPPPNRFGIRPGYRWDGVDRGTGFEKKLFQRLNERKRRGAESYEWGVEDM